MSLNDFAKQLIKNFPLGFVATVSEEGLPSLSPKGTFFVLDDETIAFAEIRSPNTMKNIAHQPKVEVNFIDIWLRKGVRVFGGTEICERGTDDFNDIINIWEAPFPALAPRINAIVKVKAERVRLMTTPPYDDGVTEEEMIATYKKKWGEIYS
ncbi:MAG: pyridoxamine 5'-phosphate oxidase family protein [Rhizobiaceae bacterium]|nr:pyridoxamine 5'-phosphate oxidase family protein [Rhizobiaceae bacterium]